ncbi:hypothetical protein NP493_42g03011 [Ridgeia piscesae]|uniref:RING-type domain-containing protein n=1 Tax=Ridgeia piscesae TaxID=27915 RepID=A0AAD9UJR8_RIDPI|nr:hypothetical protein NP493_42g03011 [Ridgeia piscesae]
MSANVIEAGLDLPSYSDITSFAVIAICLVSLFVYIARLAGPELRGSPEVTIADTAVKQNVQQLYNPFRLKLTSETKASVQGGATFEVTCRIAAELRPLWAVSIDELYPAIHQPWPDIARQISDKSFLAEHSFVDDSGLQILTIETCEKKEILLAPPVFELPLGDVPRDKYPLVVLLYNPEAIRDDVAMTTELCHQVVLTVTLVHLKDDTCPAVSHVIAQYVRTPFSQPLLLKTLFVANTDDHAASGDGDRQAAPRDDKESTLCVVCQNAEVDRVLLPCRHCCVCAVCFPRLSRCPMCRSQINTYFDLKSHAQNVPEDLTAEAM